MAELLTAREVQEMLNVDRSTVYRMAEDGRLPAVKVGKQWRFPREKVEAVFGFSSNVAEPVKNSGV
ncbi:MAG: DNA-binding protein, partial [Candidatus Thermofonsia bacterium]